MQVVTPALLLLDLDVADFDVLAYLRHQTRLAATRIVIITSDVVCVHGLGGRVDAELLKPVRRDDLNDVVAGLLLFID